MAVAVERDGILTMTGIAALIDPPLPGSAQMIRDIKGLGLNIKMLTGDALPIAREIARQVGLGDDIVSAGLFRNEPDSNKGHNVIVAHNGFAEVLPEDKFNIVKALQEKQEITGMTGDGVNDAPALKQAEVGIAVKSATDIAKQAASVILLNDGLESIISLITVGRTIHHRITNWVISKIAKTLFTVIFVCSAYLITGQFVVSAFDMILLLFIIDFVSLTLSTDSVSWSRNPETWTLKPLIRKGFTIGLLNIVEGLLWLFIGKKYLGVESEEMLHSFGFIILFFTGIFNIISIRTPTRFYHQKIGKILLFAVLADILFIICISIVGIPGFSALSLVVTGSSILYFFICCCFINDWAKVRMK
ncbi:MAG TPA: HAD-IC family P-type ATPase [Puia sp.]|nr:HAD-IC family P-type ATPase [Puia sp.]